MLQYRHALSLRFHASGAKFSRTMPSVGAMTTRSKEDNDLSLTVDTAVAVEPGMPMTGTAPMALTSEILLSAILSEIEDMKAEEVVQIDLRGKSSIGDYMVVCSGRSSRQVAALSEKIVDRLKQDYGVLCKVEGKETGDWVLIDSGDVIVHVFRPEVREFYQLEKMWMPTAADTRV